MSKTDSVPACTKCFNYIIDKNYIHNEGKPYHKICYYDTFYDDITHRVHKEMTPNKFENNDYSVGMGTDCESFYLNEHLLTLAKYYGINHLETAIKECKEIILKKRLTSEKL